MTSSSILFNPLPPSFILFYPLSSSFILFHPLSSYIISPSVFRVSYYTSVLVVWKSVYSWLFSYRWLKDWMGGPITMACFSGKGIDIFFWLSSPFGSDPTLVNSTVDVDTWSCWLYIKLWEFACRGNLFFNTLVWADSSQNHLKEIGSIVH